MERILVPVDFSDISANALNYAVAFASKFQGKVTLFNAITYPGTDPLAPAFNHTTATVVQSEVLTQREALAIQNLERLSEEIRVKTSGTVIVDYTVTIGFAVDEINRLTKENKFDLVIMGTKGESGVEDTIFGTITSNVIKKIKIPVLAIPEKGVFKPIDKIVYATNYHDEDDVALRILGDLAKHFNAQVIAVHVQDDDEQEIEKRSAHLRELIDGAQPAGRFSYQLIKDKDVEHGINEFVKVNGVGMIAMLHRNLNFLQRLFDPSLAKKLAFHSEIPVMVFHIK